MASLLTPCTIFSTPTVANDNLSVDVSGPFAKNGAPGTNATPFSIARFANSPASFTFPPAPVSFAQVFLLVPPVMLITLMPISIAGWGVREATMGLAFGFAGLAANEGVNVSLLFGAVFFIVGAVGGLVWILSAEKAAQGSAQLGVPE